MASLLPGTEARAWATWRCGADGDYYTAAPGESLVALIGAHRALCHPGTEPVGRYLALVVYRTPAGARRKGGATVAQTWQCTTCGQVGLAPTAAAAAVELGRHAGRVHGRSPVEGVLPAAVLALPGVPESGRQ